MVRAACFALCLGVCLWANASATGEAGDNQYIEMSVRRFQEKEMLEIKIADFCIAVPEAHFVVGEQKTVTIVVKDGQLTLPHSNGKTTASKVRIKFPNGILSQKPTAE